MQPQPESPAGQVPVYDHGAPSSPWRDRLLAGVLCLVLGAAAGFALGRATAPSGPATLAEAFQLAQEGKLPQGDIQAVRGRGVPGGQNGQAQGAAPGRGGSPSVEGEITAVDGDVVTVSTRAGELKVKLTSSTTIGKVVAGNRSDLAAGDSVSVRLDPSASSGGDGTVTATSVTEEPAP
jgi:hypothetical protein